MPSIGRFFAGLFGYAAAATIAKALTRNGGTLAVPPEGFGVKDTKGPLVDGELERAEAWAQKILDTIGRSVRVRLEA